MPNVPPRGLYPRTVAGAWANPTAVHARNATGDAWLVADYVWVATRTNPEMLAPNT